MTGLPLKWLGIGALCIVIGFFAWFLSPIGNGPASSGKSAGECWTWGETVNSYVVTVHTVGPGLDCDRGNLLVPGWPSDPVVYTRSEPSHGSIVCDLGDWKVYEGPAGDPSGESQSVCDMMQDDE
jgi:hypothetical protein